MPSGTGGRAGASPPEVPDVRGFHGLNEAYVFELYERYLEDPSSVDERTRAHFASRPPGTAPEPPGRSSRLPAGDKVVAAVNLAQAVREYGHLAARVDPLGSEPPGDPALVLETYGLSESDLRSLPSAVVGGPIAERAVDALEAISALRDVYCGSTSYNYLHIRAPDERAWLRHAAESRRFRPSHGPFSPVALLERLTQVEVFEEFLDRVFPGKTRFSIEGLDVLVPMLDEALLAASEAGVRSVLLGMAHRGRLNVLAHVLRKPYEKIFAEFRDSSEGREAWIRDDLGWTGDVQYHLGACRALGELAPGGLTVTMVPNPSHLEFVNPVVEGMARAAGTEVDSPGRPSFRPSVSLPILIHGDASFPGQGVVAETLNLSRLEAYATGGTIHIIANNQIGFTTDPRATRSTIYASDLAKGFEVPIVHVNADDPEACIEAIRLACAYRAKFEKDFVVDLVGYRRRGHNEGDEPRYTHPLLYERIDRHPTVREIWARRLEERRAIEPSFADALVREREEEIERAFAALDPSRAPVEPEAPAPRPEVFPEVVTAVAEGRLRALHASLCRLPEGFRVHPRLARVLDRRRTAFDDPEAPGVDWALAEALSLASILEDGTAVRFTGEDVERGTFSHRHAKLHDAETGRTYVPLQGIPQAKAAFEIANTPLTECAVLGFEYGYAIARPERLVIWEAQYGDFANVAQVILDEFVAAARAKWGQTSSLVLLLPHGHEGQGPDHSSARPERFLGLASDRNLRIACPTTAAQYFHLLRRQAALLETDPVPLVVLSPKSLLRHPAAACSLSDLTEGAWRPIIDDPVARAAPEEVRRLILVSGRAYYDLAAREGRAASPWIAMARVEELYPLQPDVLEPVFLGYPNLQEIVWFQEEPQNMGAWRYREYRLREIVRGRWPLRYVGRPVSSSPAEGSAAWHAVNQRAIVDEAFRPGPIAEAIEKTAPRSKRRASQP